MAKFNAPYSTFEECFELFERAAVKGHEESLWILSVVKDVELDEGPLKETFVKTEEPLGWSLAGKYSDGRERFDFYKKSAEGGCSWGQVGYGWYFYYGRFVEKDLKTYVEWWEKAANQNNPMAMRWLGHWFRGKGGDKEKAVAYHRAAAELGWEISMCYLAEMLSYGEGCTKDLRKASIWSAKGTDAIIFWEIAEEMREDVQEGENLEYLGCDFDQLCYSLGWGLYWYRYGSDEWELDITKERKLFSSRCIDYYCSCVEMQQKSIFTFLLCWNRVTGVKGPGQMIGKMAWERREDNLVESFGVEGHGEMVD
jgi:hypothetical protein